ncbi:carbohydrate kinase family protein [Candidatus Parcubacteria bacterium]|nr:carbohydrate kinase family protein [Candidatus Parcubacteria bacterium]
MFDIITFGSATIDIFAFLKPLKEKGKVCFNGGSKEILRGLELQTGGGGTNTAVSFANFGLKTAFCGQIGNDLFADFIQADLLKRKVDISLLKRNPEAKSDVSLVLSPLKGERIILSDFSSTALPLKEIPFEKLKTKWFYLAPLHLKNLPLLKLLVDFAFKEKIKTAVNPSKEQASQLSLEIIKKIDCLIVNEQEYSLLKEKVKYFKGILVITKGSKGCSVAYQGKSFEATARKIKAKEATGAGDAFASGLITGLFLKNDIQYGIALGLFNSESCIQEIGAKNGLLKKKQLLKIPTYKIKIKNLPGCH